MRTLFRILIIITVLWGFFAVAKAAMIIWPVDGWLAFYITGLSVVGLIYTSIDVWNDL